MNGSNEYGVSFAQIKWIEKLLRKHPNVTDLSRDQDILFHITRLRGIDINLVCLDEYTCGLARVYEVLDDFSNANLLYVGGMWNGYTKEAKKFCIDSEIGLFNTSEMNGALHRDDFWAYHKKDEDGNPDYPFKVG